MAWSVSVPVVAPEDFNQTVELALQAARPELALTGSVHAAELAATAAKDLLHKWDVASERDRTFGATLEGHANPGGEAVAGFGNDTISVTVWRSGNREPSFDRAVQEAVKVELKKAEDKQARADARAEKEAAEAKAKKKAEREVVAEPENPPAIVAEG